RGHRRPHLALDHDARIRAQRDDQSEGLRPDRSVRHQRSRRHVARKARVSREPRRSSGARCRKVRTSIRAGAVCIGRGTRRRRKSGHGAMRGVPPSTPTKWAVRLMTLIILATAGFLFAGYDSLPDLLPVRFRTGGVPSGWQWRTPYIVMLPVFVELAL